METALTCGLLLLILCLWPGTFVTAQSIENYTGKNIAAIKVILEGTQGTEAGNDLRGLLRVREGAAYAMADLRRSLLALYDSGRIANARVETQSNNDGTVAVTFFVTPQMRIGDVDFTGAI